MSLTLQVPALGINTELVELPLSADKAWHIEWLGEKAGVLSGSSLPGEGYSIIVAHNTLNNTEVGPFATLAAANINDLVFVKNYKGKLIRFRVYANELVDRDGFAAMEAISADVPGTLMLVTCENETLNGDYLNRRVVFARPLD
ncbi:MAG: class F sortase [Anaerolineaceae bacterium]|nr:class F sortase [Anaerolineaceae bacterium]